jgi:hypothetical protein
MNEMNVSFLDEAVKQAEGERQMDAAELDKLFSEKAERPLKPLLDGAPIWVREVREYSPTALAVIAKVGRTAYAGDVEVSGQCQELQAAIDSPAVVERGLEAFKSLKASWHADVAKYGLTNAVNKIVRNLPEQLTACRGRRKVMQRAIQRIEARIAYLMETGPYSNPQPTPPAGGIVMPEEKAADTGTIKPKVTTAVDLLGLRGRKGN